MKTQALLNRLDAIGLSLEKSGHALALIGLGSVGLELQRLDEYSDLDFFVIVEPGYKNVYISDLKWLSELCPIAFRFQNTVDGYKLLFEDGIFCEFAIFELDELREIPYSPGRIVWKQPHISETISYPVKSIEHLHVRNPEWILGEALTNLFVGLGRESRGERLSATRFIQSYAVDRLVELMDVLGEDQQAQRDNFAPDRRFEQRYPAIAQQSSTWMQGYLRNRESALAILNFLEENFAVNLAMAEAIRRLCQ